MGAASSIPIEPKVVEQPDMSPKFYLDTNSSGKPHFVKIKRSRSHHHPHHHGDHLHHHHEHRHHTRRHSHWEEEYCRPEYYKVSREEWNVLKERERLLDENNKALLEENKCLRGNVAAVQEEVTRLQHCVVPELQGRNDTLFAENVSLRRSVDTAAAHASKHHVELERLQCKIDKLERDYKKVDEENCDLRSRIRNLTRQLDQSCNRRVQELLKDVRYWKDKLADVQEVLDLRTRRMEAYEDILRRRGII